MAYKAMNKRTVLKLAFIFTKIQNAEIVDIMFEKQKAMIYDHRMYNINLSDQYLCLDIDTGWFSN